MSPVKVHLSRAQIGKAAGLDTTVKSAQGWARHFTPTWQMVMGHKSGTLSDEDYTKRYHEILAAVPRAIWRELYRYGLANEGTVVLLCYCRDEWFCHTHLLIDFAVQNWPAAFDHG